MFLRLALLRPLLRAFSLVFVLSAALPVARGAGREWAARGPWLEAGPLLGDVSATHARVWAMSRGPARLSVRAGTGADLADAREFDGGPLGDDTLFTGQALLTGLRPGTRYHYCVLLDGRPVMARPFPSLVTAPPPGTPGRVRFAFGSCVGKFAHDSAATWADLGARTNADLLLMLGDNHYGDTTDPVGHLTHYLAQRTQPAYAALSARLPQYAIWDNHDYSAEPTDRTQPQKIRTLAAFRHFWPNPAFGQTNDPGVHHSFVRGEVEFFMTDGRFHRDPNKAADGGTKSLLGTNQLAWLRRGLLASKARIKVIASGGEFQSHSRDQSWASFRRERDGLFDFISTNGITGVLLLSGDRHFTAGYQAGGRFIEITSGPLGSIGGEPAATPEMFWKGGKGRYYCIFDVDTRTNPPHVALEVYRPSEGLVHRREFAWEEILGTQKIPSLPKGAKAEH